MSPLNKITIMKKKLFLLVVCGSINIITAQTIFNGEVIYKTSHSNAIINKLKEVIKNKKMDNNTISFTEKMYRDTSIESKLVFNTLESSFVIEDFLEISEDVSKKMIRAGAGNKNLYYYNMLTKKMNEQDCKLLEDCFVLEHPTIEWEISQETKIIGSYKCYRATHKVTSKNNEQIIIAWFSPQIPFSFGPKNYSGLPGLILELDDGKIIFKAKNILLNKKEKIKVKKPKGKQITKEEFDARLRKAYPDFFKD